MSTRLISCVLVCLFSVQVLLGSGGIHSLLPDSSNHCCLHQMQAGLADSRQGGAAQPAFAAQETHRHNHCAHRHDHHSGGNQLETALATSSDHPSAPSVPADPPLPADAPCEDCLVCHQALLASWISPFVTLEQVSELVQPVMTFHRAAPQKMLASLPAPRGPPVC